VLLNPDIIATEVERRRGTDPFARDLETLERRLRSIENQQKRLSRAVSMLDDEEAIAPLLAELRQRGVEAKNAFQNRVCCGRTCGMSKPLVPDDLWAIVEPLLPLEPPKPTGGRPRVPDRAALTGIIFVLKSGIPWEMLPQEMGCGSGVTCWRRLRDWQDAGVWDRLHQTLLDQLGEAGRIDWSRASLDSASVPAKRGAIRPDRTRSIAASRARNTM